MFVTTSILKLGLLASISLQPSQSLSSLDAETSIVPISQMAGKGEKWTNNVVKIGGLYEATITNGSVTEVVGNYNTDTEARREGRKAAKEKNKELKND